jgi:hypothetical protein
VAPPETRPEQERRTRWSFAYHADNTWNWHKKPAAGQPQRSEVRLETLADALTDAMAHGYVAWERHEERRRERPEELLDE